MCAIRGAAGEYCLFKKLWTIFSFGCWVETEQGRRLVREQQLILQIPPKVTPIGAYGICYQQIYQDLKQEKNNIQVKVRKTTQLYCRDPLQERETETDPDRLSGPFRTFIKDPPVLCRGFIDRIRTEPISISLQEKVKLIIFTVPSKIYQSREDRRQEGDRTGECEASEQTKTNHQRILRKLVCSFLMEPQSVPQHINV